MLRNVASLGFSIMAPNVGHIDDHWRALAGNQAGTKR